MNEAKSSGNPGATGSDAGASALIAARLGAWVADLSPGSVPEAARRIARRCIIDTIAVAIAGSSSSVAQRLREHVLAQYAPGGCTILGTNDGASALGAALANGVSGHALDFDDTSYAGVVHGSVVVLPAVLAVAQQEQISGARCLEAFVAGGEVVYGLGLTLTQSHYMKGWWATGTLGAVGAAAGCAKALGLDADKTTTAIALAALQANGMVAALGADAKPILAGQAAKLGAQSALLAAQGNSAPPAVFEDRRGLLTLMNDGHQDAAGLEGLGRTWRLLQPGIAIKRAPVCSAAQAAIECVEKLISDNGLNRAEIKAVICEVPHLVKISLVHESPTTPSQAQFSMPFAVGCILAFGRLGGAEISDETLGNPSLQNAMERIAMIEADDLNGPQYQPHHPECARVTVAMTGGDVFTHFIGAATGMPENPMSDDALSEKFRSCASFAGWPDDKAAALLERLQNIETADSVGLLIGGDE